MSAVSRTILELRKWEYSDDPRRITLYRTSGNILILEVFDRFTKEHSHRILPGKGAKYEARLLEEQHPELARLETGRPPCAAMFVDNGTTLEGKAYGGPDGCVEVRVYTHPTLRFVWTILNTATNQSETIPGTPEHALIREHVNQLFVQTVQYDPRGVPRSFTLHSKPDCVFQAPSKFSPDKIVDSKTWAVTLIVTRKKNGFLASLGGHASICVEGIRDGVYFIKRCHIASVECGAPLLGRPGRAHVEVEETAVVVAKLPRIKERMRGKSPTWLKGRPFIEAMLRAIEAQKEEEERAGEPLVPFNIRGFGPERGYNCMSWAKEQLERASIELSDVCSRSLATYPSAFVE